MGAAFRERARTNATETAGTVVTGLWLVALVSGREWWLAAMLFGYLVVVPVVSRLSGEDDEGWIGDDRETTGTAAASDAGDGGSDALETLGERCARGELTDEQFERKLGRLLDTETLEGAD